MRDVSQVPTIQGESGPSANEAAAGLLTAAGLDPALIRQLTVTGADPQFPAIFRIGTAAAAAVGAASLAVTEVWRQRTGRVQTVSVNMRHAAATYRAERYAHVDGIPPVERGDRLGLGFFRTADDRFIRFQTSLPHHRQAALEVLGCDDTHAAGLAAVSQWNAFDLEQAIADRGGIPAVVLTHDEWARHPQGEAVLSLPVVEITKIADSPPQPFGESERPLGGVRVIDLSRVISGPTCCRFLAGHGADVIQLSAPGIADWGLMDIATGFGKRSAWLDLRTDRDAFGALVDRTDVLVQGMRPGVLASHGFGPEAAAERRPGIIYVDLSGFGHLGPWADRACYDSMLQCHDGIAYEGALYREGGEPVGLPCQVMDHSTAYIAALGVVAALTRRAHEGGSYLIRVSLASTGEWVKQLGRVDGARLVDPDRTAVEDLMSIMDTPFGRVHYLPPAEQLSETPPFYAIPTAPFGTHEPVWE